MLLRINEITSPAASLPRNARNGVAIAMAVCTRQRPVQRCWFSSEAVVVWLLFCSLATAAAGRETATVRAAFCTAALRSAPAHVRQHLPGSLAFGVRLVDSAADVSDAPLPPGTLPRCRPSAHATVSTLDCRR